MAKKTIMKRRRDGVIQRYNVIPKSAQRQLIKENYQSIGKELKRSGRIRIPEIGILSIKNIKAKKGGKKIMMFGKESITKSKPAYKKIKFRASKSLKDLI